MRGCSAGTVRCAIASSMATTLVIPAKNAHAPMRMNAVASVTSVSAAVAIVPRTVAATNVRATERSARRPANSRASGAGAARRG